MAAGGEKQMAIDSVAKAATTIPDFRRWLKRSGYR
jgi:hypothetical protein